MEIARMGVSERVILNLHISVPRNQTYAHFANDGGPRIITVSKRYIFSQ